MDRIIEATPSKSKTKPIAFSNVKPPYVYVEQVEEKVSAVRSTWTYGMEVVCSVEATNEAPTAGDARNY